VNSAAGIFPPADDAHVNSLCPKTYQFRSSLSAFSRDLSLLVFVNSSGLLEGYEVLPRTQPWPPYPLENLTTTMALSPDGSLIALGNESGRISFINGKTGQFLGEIIGNFGTLEAIEFSEDGRKLATAGADGLVRIFAIAEVE
jgi:WD40 repeat protein